MPRVTIVTEFKNNQFDFAGRKTQFVYNPLVNADYIILISYLEV